MQFDLDRRTVLGLGLGGMTLLAGCASSVTRTTWPDITFQHQKPISLGVSDVVFVDTAVAGAAEPPARDIHYALPASPAVTMERWSVERINPAGGPGIARVNLVESRFVEVPLGATGGVEGVFTIDQSARYEGRLEVRIGIEGDPSGHGFVQASATSSRTVPEDYSLNQRGETLYDMLAGMVNALDERLEQEMRAKLTRWVLIG